MFKDIIPKLESLGKKVGIVNFFVKNFNSEVRTENVGDKVKLTLSLPSSRDKIIVEMSRSSFKKFYNMLTEVNESL